MSQVPFLIILLLRSTEPVERKELKFRLKSRGVIAKFCIINLMASFGGVIFFNLFPYYVNMKFGVNSGALGILYFISNFIQAGANISAAKLAKITGALRAIVVSLGLSALFYMMIPLALSFAWLFIPYIVRFGLFNLSVPLISSLFMKLVDDDERATANSAVNLGVHGW